MKAPVIFRHNFHRLRINTNFKYINKKIIIPLHKPVCYLNGSWIPLSEASVPVSDLGLLRGYGLFDFLRVTENVPLFLEDHIDRFFHSAYIMRLPIGKTKDEMITIIRELVQKNNLPVSGIKILLTGGNSSDGYSIAEPNFILIQKSIAPTPTTILVPGYQLITYPYHRQMPDVKTTDYLMAIQLQPWLKEKGGDDLLYHQQGIVSECPRSNFFMVTRDNRLITPGKNILKGITRKHVLKIASEKGIVAEEKEITLEDIKMAKEAFISSSTKRLIPVIKIDDITLSPFSENSITAKLYAAFLERENLEIIRNK